VLFWGQYHTSLGWVKFSMLDVVSRMIAVRTSICIITLSCHELLNFVSPIAPSTLLRSTSANLLTLSQTKLACSSHGFHICAPLPAGDFQDIGAGVEVSARHSAILPSRLQLQSVVLSHVLWCLGLSWCPGPGHRLANAVLLSMVLTWTWNRLPPALWLPELSYLHSNRQLKTNLFQH